jgi:hypothetical protein
MQSNLKVILLSGLLLALLITTSAVLQAWNEKYVGNHHQLLLDNINRM